MKIFEIKKGTKCILSNEDGSLTQNMKAKRDAIFDIEDIVMDSISYFNNITLKNKSYKSNSTELMLQNSGGFFKFKLKEGMTKTEYKYVYVRSNDVKTIC